ncbi:cytochrome b-c1 complex subunit 10 [Brienomyrus brachyistius]|uniref:cytochrome b-c1 complex subunit 10 n=1 Tax=Brienomyrus brachyistius TaxID=42636 RepID=UPI0020B30A2F|nr:cytochrome b-c1 complex subunit 10 [Brienomyrus brachyistius]
MLTKAIGPKYISVFKAWVPTMVGWGTVGAVGLVHFTDWRVILDYVPYINGKFKNDE